MANNRRLRLVDINIDLGVNLNTADLRFGKLFSFGEESKNSLKVELFVAKYIA